MRRRTTMTLVDGVEVRARDIKTDHDVDQGVATGAITVAAPRHRRIEVGAPVDIYAGYDGATRPIFSGRVAEYEAGYGRDGGDVRVELEGWGKLLYYAYREDRGFNGPLSVAKWWRSLCSIQGLPRWQSDDVTDVDGVTLSLGDNPDYNGGWIPIEPDNPGRQIDRVVRHFGYRNFETPFGQRLQRVSGLPTEPYQNLVQYIQGQNILGVERTVTPAGMVNVVDVRGAEYQAPDTSEVAIRAFTGTYTPNPLFGTTGISTLEISDDMLGSVTLADAARRAYEIDRGAEAWRYRWSVPGDPARVPGEQVALQSRIVNGSTSTDPIDAIIGELPRPVWLMRVSHSLPERGGWVTTMEGWAGTGQAMPAGDDTDEYPLLGNQGVHIGNEYLWHYRNENPRGLEYSIPFTVPKVYTTLTIRGAFHGANSFLRSTDSTASRFEIWQTREGEYQRVASGEMPRSDEHLSERRRYDLYDSVWDPLVVPLTGRLDAGSASLKIISGKDSDVGDNDDYEVRDLTLYASGVGVPAPIG